MSTDPEALKKRITDAIAKGLVGFGKIAPAKPKSVDGHDGHELWELPTGTICKRRVYCVSCEVELIETFEPAEFVVLNLKTEIA